MPPQFQVWMGDDSGVFYNNREVKKRRGFVGKENEFRFRHTDDYRTSNLRSLKDSCKCETGILGEKLGLEK